MAQDQLRSSAAASKQLQRSNRARPRSPSGIPAGPAAACNDCPC